MYMASTHQAQYLDKDDVHDGHPKQDLGRAYRHAHAHPQGHGPHQHLAREHATAQGLHCAAQHVQGWLCTRAHARVHAGLHGPS